MSALQSDKVTVLDFPPSKRRRFLSSIPFLSRHHGQQIAINASLIPLVAMLGEVEQRIAEESPSLGRHVIFVTFFPFCEARAVVSNTDHERVPRTIGAKLQHEVTVEIYQTAPP